MMTRVRARWCAIVAAVWALGYVLAYAAVIRSQDGAIAWWYVGLVWLASLLASSVAFLRSPRPALLAALVLYAACMLLAARTLGLLLLPSVVATAVAVASTPGRVRPEQGSGPSLV
jgi:hypothetical protein